MFLESECNASNRAVANTHSSAGCGSGPACSWVPRAHRRQAVRQLGMQRLEERSEQLGARSQRGIVAAKHQAQEGLPLGKPFQRLPQQEGQKGKLELACRQQGRQQGSSKWRKQGQ